MRDRDASNMGEVIAVRFVNVLEFILCMNTDTVNFTVRAAKNLQRASKMNSNSFS